MSQNIFYIYPIHQSKIDNLITDYRFICADDNTPPETILQQLQSKPKESYLLYGNDTQKVIGLYRPEGLIVEDRYHHFIQTNYSHFVWIIEPQVGSIVDLVYEYVKQYNLQDVFYSLVSAIAKIGLKFAYKERTTTITSWQTYCEQKLTEYLEKNDDEATLFQQLQDHFFQSSDYEGEFILQFLRVGYDMREIVHIVPIYKN